MFEQNRMKEFTKAVTSGSDEARSEAVRSLKECDKARWQTLPADQVDSLVEALRLQLPKKSGGVGDRMPLHLRRDVVLVLGNIGPRATAAVPALIELLKSDESLAVREAAATALGDIGEDAHAAVPALLAMLTPDCRVSLAVRVARALGDIGGADARVKSALVELWRATAASSQSQLQVALALCKLRVDAPGLIASLTAAGVSASNTGLRTAAVEALAHCGKNQIGVVPALVAASFDEDEAIQALAAGGIEKMGLTLPKAVQLCAKQLKDSPHAAETALRKAGLLSVGVLIKSLAEEEPLVRQKASEILRAIGEPAVEAVPALTKLLSDKTSEVRLAAAKALWSVTKQADAVVPALSGLLTDKIRPTPTDSEVRRRFLQSVIEALGRIGPAATGAIPSLLLSSKDENRLVRESAVRTLHQIDPVAGAKVRV